MTDTPDFSVVLPPIEQLKAYNVPRVIYRQITPPLRLLALPGPEEPYLYAEKADLDMLGGLRWSRASGAEFRFAVLRFAVLAFRWPSLPLPITEETARSVRRPGDQGVW